LYRFISSTVQEVSYFTFIRRCFNVTKLVNVTWRDEVSQPSKYVRNLHTY